MLFFQWLIFFCLINKSLLSTQKRLAPKKKWVAVVPQKIDYFVKSTNDYHYFLNSYFVSYLLYERLNYFYNRWANETGYLVDDKIFSLDQKEEYFSCFGLGLATFEPTIFYEKFKFKRINSKSDFYSLLPILASINNDFLDQYYDQIYLNELTPKTNESQAKTFGRFVNGCKIHMFILLVDDFPVGTCSVYLTSYGLGEIFNIHINPKFEDEFLREYIVEQACLYLKKLNFQAAITWLYESDYHFNNFTFIN